MRNAIILVSNTGHGKSFISNKYFQMCSSSQKFASSGSVSSVSDTIQQGAIIYKDLPYTLVDTPGFFDVRQNSTEKEKATREGENVCKLVRALEDAETILAIVYVFVGRFDYSQKLWYDQIVKLVGPGYKGHVILCHNKQRTMSLEEHVTNKFEIQHLVKSSDDDGKVHYFPLCMHTGRGGDEEEDEFQQQLVDMMDTIVNFAPFSLKNLVIPEVCYEREEVGEVFEREMACNKSDVGGMVTNLTDKSYYEDRMVPAGDPLMRLFGGKEKIREHHVRMVEEKFHVVKEVTNLVTGKYRNHYKIRFDGTRDFVREEFIKSKEKTYE